MPWSVGLCVCLLDTLLFTAKTTEPIEMPFGKLSRVGPRNRVSDWGPGRPRRKKIGVVRPIEKHCEIAAVYAKTTEPIEMPFGAELCGPTEACIR